MNRVDCDTSAVHHTHEPDNQGNFELWSIQALVEIHAVEDEADDDEAASTDHDFAQDVVLGNKVASKVDKELEEYDEDDHEVEGGPIGELATKSTAIRRQLGAVGC